MNKVNVPLFYYNEEEGPVVTNDVIEIEADKAEELIEVFSITYLGGLGFHEHPDTEKLVKKLDELGLLEYDESNEYD